MRIPPASASVNVADTSGVAEGGPGGLPRGPRKGRSPRCRRLEHRSAESVSLAPHPDVRSRARARWGRCRRRAASVTPSDTIVRRGAAAWLVRADTAVSAGAEQVSTTHSDDLPHDERDLIGRAQRGDPTAFHDLYERFAPSVHRYAIAPLVHDRALAEDLLADTFVRALENIQRFRWQGKGVLPWLIRIAKNLCLDHLRKSGRVGAWPVEFEHLLPDPTDLDGETVASHRQINELLRERIDTCLQDVNPRYRKVLRLRLVESMARDQAAAEMEVSIGTLDVLLFRACKAFRKVYLQRYGHDPLRDFDSGAP